MRKPPIIHTTKNRAARVMDFKEQSATEMSPVRGGELAISPRVKKPTQSISSNEELSGTVVIS